MATSLSSFLDASSPGIGLGLGEQSLFTTSSSSHFNSLGTASSLLIDQDQDLLTQSVLTAIHRGGKNFNSSTNTILNGSPEAGDEGGTGGRERRDWNSSMEELLKLHIDYEKFRNLTTQALCNGDDSDAVYAFANSYKKIHGYLALAVCVFGAIANTLIMVVLTRKEMRTPVNLMLFALAIADLLVMLEYIPFALHMYLIENGPEAKHSFTSAWFVFFHVHFTQILHTINIQLTLSMAIWRYAAIKCSTQSSTFCTFKRCYQVIAAAYICPLFFCILNYLYFQIAKKTKYLTYGPPPFNEIDGSDEETLKIFGNACTFLHVHDCNSRKVEMYVVEESDLVKEHPILHTIHFWTFSVLIKLIPCVVLTFFMCWLVNTLYKARRHHKMLENKSALPMTPVNQTIVESQPLSPSKSKTIHPQSDKSVSLKMLANGNSRNIRLGGNNEDGFGSPKAALLAVENGHSNHFLSVTNSLNPSPIPPESQTCQNSVGGGLDSRRASAESAGNGSAGGGNGGRRFTKGFIRFPSIRRHSGDPKSKSQKSCKRTDRTSKMLIAVLLLFLLTEFPQGIMHFLTGWYGPEFLRCNYNHWAEIWDMLALINSAINFLLYCFMSKQFRTQFHLSFKLHFCFKKPQWISMANCNNNATVSTTV